MPRMIRVAGAQLGPIFPDEARSSAVSRMIALMREAADRDCDVVVFPELALTTFMARRRLASPDDANVYCETEMPGAHTQPLFDMAKSLGIGFYLGYAELAREEGRMRRYNAAVLVGKDGNPIGKYRKVHIPGRSDPDPSGCASNYEKYYFSEGNLGFPVFRAFGGIVGMALCNDRRWPETYRVLGLQGVELVMIGYNTIFRRLRKSGERIVQEPPHLETFHNHLVMQAGAYQNATWVVGVAKAGAEEEGLDLIGGSCIIAPTGEIVALARTLGDELIVADCDLEAADEYKRTMFDFARHRRIEHYGLITTRRGAVPPPSRGDA